MNTFVIFWNPHFSNYKVEHFLDEFDFEEERDLLTEDDWGLPEVFRWNIAGRGEIRAGDRFFFVRVGREEPTGMMAAGYFVSEPYEGEEWDEQGRTLQCVDLQFDEIVNPASDKVLPILTLEAAVPEIDWARGRAEQMVSEELAEQVEDLWKKHVEAIW